jgi:hypothetical protein
MNDTSNAANEQIMLKQDQVINLKTFQSRDSPDTTKLINDFQPLLA